jgi:hypothetical protein
MEAPATLDAMAVSDAGDWTEQALSPAKQTQSVAVQAGLLRGLAVYPSHFHLNDAGRTHRFLQSLGA